MIHASPRRIDEILDGMQGLRATVIGDVMLDIYLSGPVHRISPEAPVPVVHVAEERVALGGAANVAANVAGLGADCYLIGCVGRDSAADDLRTELNRLGPGAVHPYFVTCSDRPTTTKTRVMARRQQVVRFDREHDRDLGAAESETLREWLAEPIRTCDVLILEDYNKGVLTPVLIRAAIATARDAGIPVVVDPKFRNVFEYTGATVFKPNLAELSAALGEPARPEDDLWLQRARERFSCDHLLVTLGEEGMALRSADGSTFRIPAMAREVFDVSGAGDTVTAFVALAVAAGASVREAAEIANLAAAIEVGKPGVAAVTRDEVRDLMAALDASAGARAYTNTSD